MFASVPDDYRYHFGFKIIESETNTDWDFDTTFEIEEFVASTVSLTSKRIIDNEI
ncbi:MAG TPA: hypothetical protein PLN69_05010 [bacterium]|nr:hypothetical protein [bacterium]